MTGTPVVDGTSVTFELVDRRGRLSAVRLAQEIGLAGPLDFARTQGAWRLALPRPEVDRMEYLFEVEDHNGNRATILDPANPRHAPGAFGDKSVAEFPGYRRTGSGWTSNRCRATLRAALSVDARPSPASCTGTLWAPTRSTRSARTAAGRARRTGVRRRWAASPPTSARSIATGALPAAARGTARPG